MPTELSKAMAQWPKTLQEAFNAGAVVGSGSERERIKDIVRAVDYYGVPPVDMVDSERLCDDILRRIDSEEGR